MNPIGRVLLVCAASHAETIRQIMAAHQVKGVEIVLVHDEPSQNLTDQVRTLAARLNEFSSATSELVNHLRDLCKVAYELGPYFWDERQAVLDGISEVREWLEHHVQQVLKAIRRPRQTHPIIFQPCWSSRRWKSLT